MSPIKKIIINGLMIAFATVPFSTIGQDLPLLCATSINKNGGENNVSTQARFAGGIAKIGEEPRALARVTRTDTVEVISTLKPDPAHIGQPADILITVGFAPITVETPTAHFMLGPNQQVLDWDGKPENAVAFQTLTLTSEQTISLYTGHLPATGHVWVHIHYRLADGTIISSADPIDITVLEPVTPVKGSDEDKDWTIMVYIVGSDLESNWEAATEDIFEMLAGTDYSPTDALNIVVATGGSATKGWRTVKYYQIHDGRGHETPLKSFVAEESDMANPQTLANFVTWTRKAFPAPHNALILWNHGGGTNGFGKDTANSHVMMDLQALYQAFKMIRDKTGLLDIVVYDACLMATVEVAQITAVVTNTMAASVEVEPLHGLDYKNLLRQVSNTTPSNGLTFGQSVVSSYIQHAKDEHTFDNNLITYSVFDLTQMEAFNRLFTGFAIALRTLFMDSPFLSYEQLSHGIIRAPAYPIKNGSKWIQRRVKGRLDHPKVTIRIDLINILETVPPEYPDLYYYARRIIDLLEKQFAVKYAGNLSENYRRINDLAGRVTLNIGGSANTYLDFLKDEMNLEAYTILHEALNYYSERVRTDVSMLSGKMDCYQGFTCASATWLELAAREVISIDGYFGQGTEDFSEIYLIKPLYRYNEALTEDLQIGVDGQEACQYQICVGENQCENATLTAQGEAVLIADISLNDAPALLSFCRGEGETWYACGALAQNLCPEATTNCEAESRLWGRTRPLAGGDQITPNVLQLRQEAREQYVGHTLTVDACLPVQLRKQCDATQPIIYSASHGNNNKQTLALLCDGQDCICRDEDVDNPGCRATGMKAGVIIQY